MRSIFSFSRAALIVIGFAAVVRAPFVSAYQVADSRYSPRLGVYYELVNYGGAHGARITAAPVPGSPLLQEQIRLEEGDVITHLDRTPITGGANLEQHRGQTSVQFVNARTNAVEVRWVYLPAMNAPPVPGSPSGLAQTSAVAGYSPRLGAF